VRREGLCVSKTYINGKTSVLKKKGICELTKEDSAFAKGEGFRKGEERADLVCIESLRTRRKGPG